MNLEQVKNDLRVDHDFDDVYIQALIDTAVAFVMGSIERKTIPDDPRFDSCVFLLVSNWYNNREPATNAILQEIPFGITALIHQLRGLGAD